MFIEHHSALTTFFRRRVGHRWDAQDLTQEVYLRLLRADQRELIRNPEAYLRTVASNLVREYVVLQKHLPQPVASPEQEVGAWLAAEGELPDDDTDPEVREARLAQVLDTLPPRHRAVLFMQHRDGLSYRQIAQELGVSTHMVKKYVVKALALCRHALREREEAG